MIGRITQHIVRIAGAADGVIARRAEHDVAERQRVGFTRGQGWHHDITDLGQATRLADVQHGGHIHILATVVVYSDGARYGLACKDCIA